VRDRLLRRWISSVEAYRAKQVRMVGYLSAEFLLGPHLMNNMLSLCMVEPMSQALGELGLKLSDIIDTEPEPGLGNGGLGRLAACYMDSLATLHLPAIGYGLRYEYGIFQQEIRDGWQVEKTDKWLQFGNPWEIARPESGTDVGFGGHTETYSEASGEQRVRWVPDRIVRGIPYDTLIPGHCTNTVNSLRLWKAEAPERFDFAAFNVGDYYGSVREKVQLENISKILYPNDDNIKGKELRLEQQFFFVSCSLQDMIKHHKSRGGSIEDFDQKNALQLNDTHPSVGVAELMRLMVDVHHVAWDTAWRITQNTFGYTNHTLLPEALERWPIQMFGGLLPRHLEIIYEINRRFLGEVRAKYPGEEGRVSRLSLIDESGERYVRMANLASIGSHAINGVAALHTELLKKDVLRDFYEMYPERFSNKTNGITPRRWLLEADSRLAALITSRIGDSWVTNLDELKKLEPLADDANARDEWRESQKQVKAALTAYIHSVTSIAVDPASLFDVMVKRLHEYKRQHLKVLHIITQYQRLKKNPDLDIVPRTFIFGGKAAPGYFMAKLIIKLINSVGDVVNADPDMRGRLRVVFLPNYNVTVGQKLYPSADLSEQISLAGKEASGTGNMKFALTNALTIGTLDGANIEIRDRVGHENFFLFGLTVDQVNDLKAKGYHPRDFYSADAELRDAVDAIDAGHFSDGDRKLFRPLVDNLMNSDPYLLFADYRSYVDTQDRVDQAFRDQDHWTRMSILNTARMGYFSSDRAIREYAAEIWNLKPVNVQLT
ncbi:MAG: glycogen/starch/alpha-glucan phosphorylase, partial [Bryobacteraceae bacterium]